MSCVGSEKLPPCICAHPISPFGRTTRVRTRPCGRRLSARLRHLATVSRRGTDAPNETFRRRGEPPEFGWTLCFGWAAVRSVGGGGGVPRELAQSVRTPA